MAAGRFPAASLIVRRRRGSKSGIAMAKLTKRVVDSIRPDRNADPVHRRDVFVWDSGDGALKGFGVRMKPSGAASYIVQYRNAEGRTAVGSSAM
jgi:hypothetical protein